MVVVDFSSRTFQTSSSSKSPFLNDRHRAVVRPILPSSMTVKRIEDESMECVRNVKRDLE